MKNLYLLPVLFVLLLHCENSIGQSWSALGPASNPEGSTSSIDYVGRINCIKIDPSNSNIIYAGAATGGLWKTTNGGASWTPIGDNLPVIAVSDLVIDPTSDANNRTLYVATGDADNGATANNSSQIDIGRVNSAGIYKSIDGGVTWNATGLNWATSLSRVISKLIIHPSNPQILLAATSDGVYKTTDGGSTWVKTLTASVVDIKFNYSDPSIVYTSGTAFYKSTGTGDANTYTQITSGLPASGIGRIAIAVSPSYTYLLIAGVYGDGLVGVYRSANNGSDFQAQCTSSNVLFVSQGLYDLALVINPANENDIYAAATGIFRSQDGGVSWTSIFISSSGYTPHPDFHALEFLQGSSTTIFIGNDGGIVKTTDNGNSYSNLTNLPINQIYGIAVTDLDENLVITGSQDNGDMLYKNGSWSLIRSCNGDGDGAKCLIDYSDVNTWYVGGVYGDICKSTDGDVTNTTLTSQSQGGGFMTPYIMHPTDHNTLLVGRTQVFRTTDGGTTWNQLGTLSTGSLKALAYAPSDPNYIYAASTTNFSITSNGNDNTPTWTNRTAGLPISSGAYISSVAVDPLNPQRVWVSLFAFSAGNKVWYSADAGQHWQNVSGTLPNNPVFCIIYQNGSNDALYIGTDAGVYYRNASMSDWIPFNTGLPNVKVLDLGIQNGAGKILAGSYGRGLWKSDLYGPIVTLQTGNISSLSSCAGSSISVPYTATGTFNNDNNFIAQLSDANGSFASPQSIGSVNAIVSGTINCVIPLNSISGTNYTIRVVSSDPQVAGVPDSSVLAISALPSVATAQSVTVLPGVPLQLTATASMVSIPYQTSDANPDVSYPIYYDDNGAVGDEERQQILFTKNDLNAAGITNASYLSSLGVSVLNSALPNPASNLIINNFSIKLQNTSQALPLSPPFIMGGFTTVYTNNISFVANWNDFDFSTPFYWDGVSNILVDICYSHSQCSTGQARIYLSGDNRAQANFISSSINTSNACSSTGGSNIGTFCPATRFKFTSVSWSPSDNLSSSTILNPIFNSSVNGDYNLTFTATAGNGCSNSANTTVIVNNNIVTSAIGGPFCTGTSLNVSFAAGGIFNNGNIFTAQLSDASGSFSSPVNIGTLSSLTSGTIGATIPSNSPTGLHYRIRVVSSNPVITGTDNGNDIVINNVPIPSPSSNSPICSGSTLNLTSSGGTGYAWTGPNNFTSTQQNPVITNISADNAGNYTVTVTNACNSATATTAVTVNLIPTVNTVNNQTVCAGASTATINFSGSGTAYNWTNNTPSIGLAASGSGNIGSFTAINNGSSPETATISITPSSSGFAYITGFYDSTLSVISRTTNSVIANIAVGGNPYGIATSPDGSTVYVGSNSGISVINTATNTVTATISSGISAPVGIAISPNGSILYVANSGLGTIAVINTATNTVTTSISVGEPSGLAISPDGSLLYAGTNYTLSVISTASNTVIASIAIPGGAEGITVSPDGTRVYATSLINNTLSVINTGTDGIIATIGLTYSPGGVAISPDGSTVYLANYGAFAPGSVSVISTASNTITGTIAVGVQPVGVSVSNDGRAVYVANSGSDYMSVINTANSTVTNVNVGSGQISLGNFVTGTACSGTPVTFNIIVNPLPPATASNNGPVCSGNALTLSASGGTSYSWTGPNGFSSTLQAPGIANAQSANAGIYTVTVTGVNGCSATASTSVTINQPPTANASSNSPICSGGTLNLTSNSGSSYSWTGPNGFSSALQAPGIANAQSANAGTYTVRVTGSNGCSATASTSATINQPPTATASSNSPICSGNTLNLYSSAGTSYSWTGPNGFTSTQQNPSITNAATPNAGTYTVTVTVTNACANATANTTVAVSTMPTVNTFSNQTSCAGSLTTPISFSGSSGTIYNWTNDDISIGLAAAGTGNIPSFTGINNGTSAISSTINVTPVSSGYAYILNLNGKSVSVINTATNTVSATVTVGLNPVAAAISPDGSKLYVTNTGSNTVSVINIATNTVVNTIALPSIPYGLVMNALGTKLYVMSYQAAGAAVWVINPATNLITATIPVVSSPWDPKLSPDGSKLYIGSFNSDSVSVVSTATETLIKNIYIGQGARDILFSPNGSLMYVTSIYNSTISVVNTSTDAVVAIIHLGGCAPAFPALSSDGNTLYVVNQGGNNVFIINTITNSVITTIGVGSGSERLIKSVDGSRIYVSSTNTVTVINTASNTVIATVPVGSGASGLSLSPDGSRIYVENYSSNNVSVINTYSNTVMNTVPVGSGPAEAVGSFITTGANCSGTPVNFTITVHPNPTISTNGPTSICSGGSLTLTANLTSTYLWNTAETTQNIIISSPGTYSVTGDSGCHSSLVVPPTVSPVQPGTISAPLNGTKVCPGDQYTYTIRKVANTTGYTWTLPLSSSIVSGGGSDDTTITVLYNTPIVGTDALSVSANNYCGSSVPRTLIITPNTPAKPAAITAPVNGTKVCPNDVYTYTIRRVAPLTSDIASYDWIAPLSSSIIAGGTSSDTTITLQFNSTITLRDTLFVRSRNSCSASAFTTLIMTPNSPAKPATITAPTAGTKVCPGDIYTYTIRKVAPLTTDIPGYDWIAPLSSIIIAGGTASDTTITLQYNSTITLRDTLFVRSRSSCSASTYTTLVIMPNTPVKPGVITAPTGGTKVCPGDVYTYTIRKINLVNDIAQYNWVAPLSGSIVSGGGLSDTTITLQYNNAITLRDTLLVRSTNNCSNSAYTTLVITPNTPVKPGVITTLIGGTKVCPGDIYTYTIRKVTVANDPVSYLWTAPHSGSIIAGGSPSDTNVTIQYNSTIPIRDTLFVRTGNNCSNSAYSVLVITPNNPTKPGVITAQTGGTKVCPGDIYTYSIRKVTVPNDPVYYTWTAPVSGSFVVNNNDTTVTIQYNTTIPVRDTVFVQSTNNCSSSTVSYLVIYPNTIAKPGIITAQAGGTMVCPGNQFTYSIAAVTGANAGYNWTAPRDGYIVGATNATSVTVYYDNPIIGSDTIFVSALNGCGAGPAALLVIKANTVAPAVPTTAIVGPTAGVQSTSQIYSIVPVTGMTYNWIWTMVPVTASSGIIGVPSGTGNDSVGVSFTNAFCTGTLGVTATNTCGLTSLAKALAIKGVPGGVVGGINGQTSICLSGEPDTTIYSVAPVASATSYIWYVPAGARVIGLTTGNSVSVVFAKTFPGGNISVTPKNSCGSGASTVLAVTQNAGCRTLEATEIGANIIVYPNPTSGLATVAFNSPASAEYSLKMFDMTGREMMNQEGKTEEGINLIGLDMNGYAKGIYIISFSSADQRKEVRIVVE